MKFGGDSVVHVIMRDGGCSLLVELRLSMYIDL